eukprot:5598763-Pyramimonas_sp.AAC.1
MSARHLDVERRTRRPLRLRQTPRRTPGLQLAERRAHLCSVPRSAHPAAPPSRRWEPWTCRDP